MRQSTWVLLLCTTLLLGCALVIGCQPTPKPLPTVATVDVARYAGKWYEIAAFPKWFEKGCHCTTAEYIVREGYIEVRNSCNQGNSKGETEVATGKAFAVEGSHNAQLNVQFFWPFKGDYWILDLAPDYSYVLIGDPSRESLWILARTPQLQPTTYQHLLSKAETLGFDTSKLQRMDQSCANL